MIRNGRHGRSIAIRTPHARRHCHATWPDEVKFSPRVVWIVGGARAGVPPSTPPLYGWRPRSRRHAVRADSSTGFYRAVLRLTLRLLRLQHPHRRRTRIIGVPGIMARAVARELDIAAAVLTPTRPVSTIFVGGGTRRCSVRQALTWLLDDVRRSFDLAPGAEVTTESNPESTSPEFFAGLREAGYTRISLGMQSAAQHVLAVLDHQAHPQTCRRCGPRGTRRRLRASASTSSTAPRRVR